MGSRFYRLPEALDRPLLFTAKLVNSLRGNAFIIIGIGLIALTWGAYAYHDYSTKEQVVGHYTVTKYENGASAQVMATEEGVIVKQGDSYSLWTTKGAGGVKVEMKSSEPCDKIDTAKTPIATLPLKEVESEVAQRGAAPLSPQKPLTQFVFTFKNADDEQAFYESSSLKIFDACE